MKRKAIPKEIREQIWNKYEHHCAYCGKLLDYKDMQVDHIVPFIKTKFVKDLDIDNINNLNPSCRMCNYAKRCKSIEGFRKYLSTIITILNKGFTYRLAKNYNLLSDEENKKVKFYFESIKSPLNL